MLRPFLLGLLPSLLGFGLFAAFVLSPTLAYRECVHRALEARATQCDLLPVEAIEGACRELIGGGP